MQATSRAYKNEQKQALREKSHVYVYLGVINNDAQRTAAITTSVTSWSKPPTKGYNLEGIYATYEENFFRADGSMMFPPNGTWAMYQGAASATLKGAMRFTFDSAQDIKGLTIRFFDDAIPETFQITNGTGTYTYTPTSEDFDDNFNWTCEDEFLDSDYIEIIPVDMLNQRLRIETLLFGKGFHFQDEQLLSTSRKNSIAHLSDNIPSRTFTFTIDNTNKKFAADDPHSFVHFLQGQQEVTYDYGRDLPDGTTYMIKGGKMYLETWSNDDQQATFNTVGYLNFMDSTYYKGQYEQNGVTLYTLAERVLQDAGITNYRIDSFLNSVTTHNPLPVEKHKNLLQLIANAAMCILYEDRDGYLTISSSFEREVTSITSNGETDFSNIENILVDQDTVPQYATYEGNYFRANGSQYFLPSSGYLDCGYVSSAIADENGDFTTNPTITIVWDAAWNWFNMAFQFGFAIPKAMKIYLYKDNTLTDSFDVDSDIIDTLTLIDHDFYDVNKMVLEFTKAEANQRIHLDKIQFGKKTDFEIRYEDMSKPPAASTTEYVKNVVCHFYEFTYGTETKQIGSFNAVAGENLITFANASHNISVAYESGSGTITNVTSGTYFVKFTASVAGKVIVTGKEYKIIDSEVMKNIKTVGVDKTSKNILLDNYSYASRNLEWISDYYKNDVEYGISYRGEPALDCDDQIYIESKYVANNLVRVTEESIETSQGMSLSCSLKARRISYSEPSRVDYAITDVSEVN